MHDISWEHIRDQYLTQQYIHEQLAAEYEKQGLKYGGRSFYAIFDRNTAKVSGAGFINHVDPNDGLGVAGCYLPMVKQIHERVLDRIFKQSVKITNKRLINKFDKLHVGENGIQDIISCSDEIIYDLHHMKNWTGIVKKLIKDIERKQKKIKKGTIKQTEYLISMKELVRIATAILGKAVQLCPIETGFLRSSGKVYTYTDHIRVIFECPYATYVHENPNLHHVFGQYKFLETAAQEILRNTSVWTENTKDTYVFGKYMKQEWEHDSNGRAIGLPTWKEQIGYSAVYIDIDRNLNVNYVHYGR